MIIRQRHNELIIIQHNKTFFLYWRRWNWKIKKVSIWIDSTVYIVLRKRRFSAKKKGVLFGEKNIVSEKKSVFFNKHKQRNWRRRNWKIKKVHTWIDSNSLHRTKEKKVFSKKKGVLFGEKNMVSEKKSVFFNKHKQRNLPNRWAFAVWSNTSYGVQRPV